MEDCDMKFIKDLITIANVLDQKGLTSEANTLDEIISRAAWTTPEQAMANERARASREEISDAERSYLVGELKKLNQEMKIFGYAISDGEMTENDWTVFLRIQDDLAGIVDDLSSFDEFNEEYSELAEESISE